VSFVGLCQTLISMPIKKNKMNICKSYIRFSDDYGNDDCTFHCDLEENHSGSHREMGIIKNQPYIVTWENDFIEPKVATMQSVIYFTE
jgi:hypothetical protein